MASPQPGFPKPKGEDEYFHQAKQLGSSRRLLPLQPPGDKLGCCGFAGSGLCRRSLISLLGGVRGFGREWDCRGWTEVRVCKTFDFPVSGSGALLCLCEGPRGTGRPKPGAAGRELLAWGCRREILEEWPPFHGERVWAPCCWAQRSARWEP